MTTDAPMIRPAEIAGWPLLKLVYRTDPECIEELLPPGITPGREPHVHINVYCVPVNGEPEFGVSTKVLPGDIIVDRPGFKVFFPLTTMIVVSLVVSAILWLFRR